MMRRIRPLSFSVIALALCTACGTGRHTPPLPAPSVSALAAPTSYYAMVTTTPLSAYEDSHSQEMTIQRAEVMLLVPCAAKKGYPGISESNLTSGFTPDVTESGPFGFIDPAGGSKGFEDPQTPADPKSSTRPGAVKVTSAKEGTVLESCYTAAQATVEGNASTAFINTLTDEATNATVADKRLTAATAEWSACMKSHGFDYTDPSATGQGPWPRGQIATAKADASCTEGTDLSGIYFAVQNGYEQELIQQNLPKLRSVKQSYDQALSRAQQIISAGK